jgi:pyrroline-5-carboxylate reductase
MTGWNHAGHDIMGLETAVLGGASVGIFGAGHLGRAIADALLQAGLPRTQLLLCHSGSEATGVALAQSGLADLVVPAQALLDQAKMVLYLVRPQVADAIGGLALRRDALLVSFLAGTALARIPAAAARRVRVMVSDPDTLAKRNGIAALYPANVEVQTLLEALGLRVVLLPSEASFHAFTAMGPCLPIAAAWCLGMGKPIDRDALLALGRRYGFADYPQIVDWALAVCPKGLSHAELAIYAAHAATPGGVTEAVLNGLRDGEDLPSALERGIRRCEELARV